MKFSILTIGDEICIGQIVNTNAAWIAEKMTNIGFSAIFHSSVPDNEELMLSELARLIDNSDAIILTGGLGPTHDDITKPMLVKFFGDNLIIHHDTLDYLEKWYQSRNRTLNEINKGQALIPSKSKPLSNNVGTAPGLLFEFDNKLLIALPGVPAEMKSIFENEFIPIAAQYFKSHSKSIQLYLTIKTAGIFESSLAELIGSPQEFPIRTSLAFLPSAGSVKLRIGASGSDFNTARLTLNKFQKMIEQKAGKYIVGYGNDSIMSLIAKKLKKEELTVAVAESCTGGMLGKEFTEIPGSSMYFHGGVIAYSNSVKVNALGIGIDLINEYGAVSEQVAIEMAKNVSSIFNAHFGISITGIAGPEGGTPDKPIGTVWISIYHNFSSYTKLFRFGNDRGLNRERAVSAALLMLKERLFDK